jgi:hypothetical protein
LLRGVAPVEPVATDRRVMVMVYSRDPVAEFMRVPVALLILLVVLIVAGPPALWVIVHLPRDAVPGGRR